MPIDEQCAQSSDGTEEGSPYGQWKVVAGGGKLLWNRCRGCHALQSTPTTVQDTSGWSRVWGAIPHELEERLRESLYIKSSKGWLVSDTRLISLFLGLALASLNFPLYFPTGDQKHHSYCMTHCRKVPLDPDQQVRGAFALAPWHWPSRKVRCPRMSQLGAHRRHRRSG